MTKNTTSKFSFVKPAVYKIKVQGVLDASWSDRLGGLQINIEKSGDRQAVSVLIGQIDDQTALSGILNTLYEFHMTILSVNMMKEEN